MKQVLSVRGGGKIVREVPVPAYQPGGVLVANAFSVISSGTERSSSEAASKSPVARALARPDLVRDLAKRAALEGVQETRHAIKRRMGETWPAGYSSAGRVLEVGSAVRGLEPGDRVACAGVGYANHAEIVAVPRNLCAKVPAEVPLEHAAITTIAAVALHGIRLADVRVGDRTAVIGCGLIGALTCRLLRAAGSEVFALDLDSSKVAAATADHRRTVGPETARAIMAETGGAGVDHVLVTAASPSSDPLLLAAEIARDRAELVVVGDVPVQLPRAPLFGKELSLRVSRSYGPGRYDVDYERHGVDYPIGYVRWTEQRNMECVLDLQARGLLDLADLLEDPVPVDQAPAAYARLAGPPGERPRGAILISYPESRVPLRPPAVDGRGPAVAARPVGPHARVRVGLIGPGSFATAVILPALVAAGAELTVVGGGSGRSAVSAAGNFRFARVAHDEAGVIADGDTDAVAVCTRHATHAELSTRALQAGKHVFCEKPLALSAEQLATVVRAAEDSGAVLAVGFNRRFAPLAVELRDYLRRGGGPMTVTYRVSAGALPVSHWAHDLEQGGGRVLGELCHFVDTLVFLAGSPVREVHATGFSDLDLPSQARDNVAVTLRHVDGSIGTIVYVAHSAPGIGKERIEAFASAGIGVLDDYLTLELHGEQSVLSKGRVQNKGHREEIAAFLDGVRSGRPPVALPELTNVSLATLGVVESMRTGAPVAIETS